MRRTRKVNENINKKIGKLDIFIFLEIVLIFGYALCSFFPGLLTPDGVDQINQAATGNYKSAHPIIHSFIVGNLTKLGGIWVPALFQIITFALIWTYLCKKLRNYNDSTANKVFQFLFTFVICILPLNFIYAIILWKDILYSYAILLLLVLIFIGIKEKFNYTIGQIILIALSCVAIMKLRYNGEPIGKIMFAIIFIINIIKNRNLKQIITFVISIVVFFCLFSMPHWIFNKTSSSVNISSSNFKGTKIFCFGRFLQEDGVQIEDDEKEFLNNIIELDKWKEYYNPYTAMVLLYCDEYNKEFLSNPTKEARFYEIFSKYAKKRPDLVFDHFSKLNSIWWAEKEQYGMHSVIIDNYAVSAMSNHKYDNHPITKHGNISMSEWVVKSIANKRVYTIVYRPALYLYISVIITIIFMIRGIRKKEKGWIYNALYLFPMLMNIGTYILLMISQDLRYFYPTFLTGYFMILVCATTFIKNNKKDANKLKNNTKNPKVLIVVPAYNEEKNIKTTIEDITNNTNYDYVVINDCSKDKTKDVCKDNNFNMVSLPINYGLTSGIQIGMKYAKLKEYDIVIQFDGDGQHQAKYLNKMVNYMCKKDSDIVIGSRFANRRKPLSARMLGSRLLTFIIKLVTGKKIKDPTSGMRAYGKRAINEFCTNASLTPEPDTLVYMIKSGYKIDEVQVEMSERKFGESYLNPIKSIKYMANMIMSILFIRSIG